MKKQSLRKYKLRPQASILKEEKKDVLTPTQSLRNEYLLHWTRLHSLFLNKENRLLGSLLLTDCLGNSHLDLLLHASVAEPAMAEPTRTAERDATSMTSSSSGESDGGRGSLDDGTLRVAVRGVVRTFVRTVMRLVWVVVMVLHHQMMVLEVAILGRAMLSMNTERDKLGTSDVASEVLGIIFSITEFGVLGKVE